jgi:hypothetical protein
VSLGDRPSPPHPLTDFLTFRGALRFALLIGDDDSVAALLAIEEAAAVATERLTYCTVHGCGYDAEDGCGRCRPERQP